MRSNHFGVIGQSLNNTFVFINQLFNRAMVRHTKCRSDIMAAFYYRFRLTPRFRRIVDIDDRSID
jgi:hypothetical protein